MNLGQFNRYGATERVAEVSHPGPIDAERRFQIIVCRKSIELRGEVGGRPSEGHITAIFSQHDGESGAHFHGTCPFQLPHCQVGVSVKAEKDAGCSLWITDDETREKLTVRSAVARATGLDRVFVKTRWLKENPLLGLPKKSHQAEQQREHKEGGNHMRALRGFQ